MSRGRTPGEAPCAGLAEDRSALVAGSLGLAQQERLLAHLVGCDGCRAEVLELRRLRETLRTPPAGPAPGALAARLVSIAGAEAEAPLWCRPFRRTRRGALTSRRRALRLRRTAAAVAVSATVAGVGVVGYVAAPVLSAAAVVDPGSEAQVEFTAVLASFPLTNATLGAVLAAPAGSVSTPAPVAGAAPATLGDRPLTSAQAHATMARAAAAAESVSFTGVQALQGVSHGQAFSATVQVQAGDGDGVRVQVLDQSGSPVSARYSRTAAAARMVDQQLLTLLEDNYALRAWSGAEVTGRPATVVEARRDGRLAARWWVDRASGVVLAQQSFDRLGQQVLQARFTSIRVDAPTPVVEHVPARLVPPTTDTVLTLDAVPALAAGGWVCRERVGTLSLVRLRTDSADDPSAVHLVYSDGLATISVFEQRGSLPAPSPAAAGWAPAGTSWDDGLGAYVRDEGSSLASWQSGSRVFTVVTDGSTELLASAVASLPHEPPPTRTTMGRIRAGWGRILVDVKG